MKRYLVQSEKAVSEMLERLSRHEKVAIDSEFRPCPRHARQEMIGWSFCVREGNEYIAYYVPLGHRSAYSGTLFAADAPHRLHNIPEEFFFRKAKPLFESPRIVKVCHSAETESAVLKHRGIELQNWRDTMIEAWAFDENGLYPYRLKEITPKLLGYRIRKITDVVAGAKTAVSGGMEKADLSVVPPEDAALYAQDDAIATLRLDEWLEPKLREQGIWPALERIEFPMVRVFRDMCLHGIQIDVGDCSEQKEILNGRIAEIERRIFRECGETFNINSRQQLGKILFEKLKYPEMRVPDPNDPAGERTVPYRTPTGQYKTSDDVLEWLAGQGYPVAELIRDYGDLMKLRGTYLDAFLESVDGEGRYHPSIWQCGTVTGRGSGDMQQIPRPDKDFDREWKRVGTRKVPPQDRLISIRRLVSAPKGSWLICADYNQLELRLLAHFSGDPALVGCYARGEDLHQGTADVIARAGVPGFPRQDAKPINFGLVYGLSLQTFTDMFGEQVGRNVFHALNERFKGALMYKKAVIHCAREDGYIRTLAWRKRRLPEIRSLVRSVRGYAERQAFNALIQGSAADVVKMAQVALMKLMPDVPQVLQIHDEILFEFKGTKRQAEEAAREIKRIMESVAELAVPLVADPGVAKNWLEGK